MAYPTNHIFINTPEKSANTNNATTYLLPCWDKISRMLLWYNNEKGSAKKANPLKNKSVGVSSQRKPHPPRTEFTSPRRPWDYPLRSCEQSLGR